MEKINTVPDINFKYFPLKEDYVYAQFSSQMDEAAYQKLTGVTPGES
jgi:hypothetical protein